MPLDLPESAQEIDARSKADVQSNLETSNPYLKNSWLGAITTASANRHYDFDLQLNIAIKQSFPDTSTDDFLIRWAAIWGKQLQPATQSSGSAVATGVNLSVIPNGTIMNVSGVGDYITTEVSTITDSSANIQDLIRVSSTVTATTVSPHNLASSVSVTISGAANAEYNITTVIIVTSDIEFQYEVSGAPPDEIGTSAIASFTTASVPIRADFFGANGNIDPGTQLILQSPIIGVDDTLVVDADAIGGGTDEESEERLRQRMLDKIQNPVALFNVSAIIEQATEVPGVTRVFVEEITPDVGQVTVYFMRDNDDNPIPVGSEVQEVKESILQIKPAHTADQDVIVLAPVGVSVDFSFSSLTPNSLTMQSAIIENLRQFFEERTEVGKDVDEDAYRSAIFNTVDTVTGDEVVDFVLSTPVGDIPIASGEIGILGNVSFL